MPLAGDTVTGDGHDDHGGGPRWEELSPIGEALLMGRTLEDPSIRALLGGYLRDAMDRSGLGLDPEIGALVDLFRRDAQSRALMAIARRAGCTFGEARRRWADPEDLAAEIAWDAIAAAHHWAACPSCGLDPADLLDPETKRRLSQGRWKLQQFTCEYCAMRAAALAGRDKDDTTSDYRWVPRAPGDPLLDH